MIYEIQCDLYVCICVCVCVRERERQRETERERCNVNFLWCEQHVWMKWRLKKVFPWKSEFQNDSLQSELWPLTAGIILTQNRRKLEYFPSVPFYISNISRSTVFSWSFCPFLNYCLIYQSFLRLSTSNFYSNGRTKNKLVSPHRELRPLLKWTSSCI